MAEKPVRKTPKRGPTKAAALKALGLTQEDLDALKSFKEGAGAAKPNDDGQAAFLEASRRYDEEREKPMTKEALDVLTGIPDGTLSGTAEVVKAPEPEGYYVRNLRHVEFRFRLQWQEKPNERATHLKPRGMRGDMVKIKNEDLHDANLQANIAYGILEVIPETEAINVITKQYTNVQQVHGPTALLRNAKGEEYSPGAVHTDPEFNSQGIKVADLQPVVPGELGNITTDGRGNIRRDIPQQHNVAPVTGNPAIVSDGFAQTSTNLGAVDPNAVAKDALARSKDFEGPGAGLGTVSVVVEPVRRT